VAGAGLPKVGKFFYIFGLFNFYLVDVLFDVVAGFVVHFGQEFVL